ncbi:hypothetical protein [Corynebacterium deserti]|uniref:hypothetical protein n=1 Tax=Corynebacterium deserti TaxID=1408191 RepID=UPI0012E2BAE0|nr:hypothetical protein [Corynebacterium deserti]
MAETVLAEFARELESAPSDHPSRSRVAQALVEFVAGGQGASKSAQKSAQKSTRLMLRTLLSDTNPSVAFTAEAALRP